MGEDLHARVSKLLEDGAKYGEDRNKLLKAAGETATTYGHKLFEFSGEVIKAMTGNEIMDYIDENRKWVVSKCQVN